MVPPRVQWVLQVEGSVQGVGYRDLVVRVGTELRLAGWVSNDARDANLVHVVVQGNVTELEHFVRRIGTSHGPIAPRRILRVAEGPPDEQVRGFERR